jgi:alpha-beta hydrolase superfamily lysophospholipase
VNPGQPLVRDGAPQLWARYRDAPNARAVVTLVHGFAEHGGRYGHVQHALASAGFASLAVDYRGWGLAAGRRGFVERWDDYLDDVDAMLALAAEHAAGRPLVLLGHSQGGLLAALHAIERPGAYRALVLSSPAFAIAADVPGWKVALAHVFSRLWPAFSLASDLDVAELSHDVEVQREFLADPLVVRRGTARWFTEFLAAQRRAASGAEAIAIPTLGLVGEADGVVNPAAVRAFLERVPAGRFRGYPGLRHELFNELERERVFEELLQWLASEASGLG